MKTFRAARGPFAERPYYSDAEIERTCSEELRQVELLPRSPEPVRIDRYIEKRFRVTIAYDDLGKGLLGYTQFAKSGVTAVVISRSLDEENTVVAERRIRSTLAHEAGHGIFHAHLFMLTGQCGLFPAGSESKPRVLCRDEPTTHRSGYKGQWWEYQANRAIGSLLLPRALMDLALANFMEPVGALGLCRIRNVEREAAARSVAETFEVNPAVARLRINEMHPECVVEQAVL